MIIQIHSHCVVEFFFFFSLFFFPPPLFSKSAVPEKEDDLVYDLVNNFPYKPHPHIRSLTHNIKGVLCAIDASPLDVETFRTGPEEFMKNLARDNAQLLLNRVFQVRESAAHPPPFIFICLIILIPPQQPAVKTTEGVFAELPPLSLPLPREKPLPKQKATTKWDEFAKTKGIQKRKRSLKAWDEAHGEFMPRFGYGSAKNDKMNDWLVELPDSGTGFEDPRAEAKADRKKKIHQQEKQRLSNKARAKAKGMRQIPGSDSIKLLTGGARLSRNEMKQTIKEQMKQTKKGTASAGVFAKTLQDEPKLRRNKQKRAPNTWSQDEKGQQHKVLDRVLKKEQKSAFDVNKAVTRHIEEAKQKKGKESAAKKMKTKGGKKK